MFAICEAQCAEPMAEEGTSPVRRVDEGGQEITPGKPWNPTSGQTSTLTVDFPASATVTAVRVTDNQAPVSFTVSFKPDTEGADFQDVNDEDNNPRVIATLF